MEMAMHLNSMAKKIMSYKQFIQCLHTKKCNPQKRKLVPIWIMKRRELKTHETIEFKWMRINLVHLKAL